MGGILLYEVSTNVIYMYPRLQNNIEDKRLAVNYNATPVFVYVLIPLEREHRDQNG